MNTRLGVALERRLNVVMDRLAERMGALMEAHVPFELYDLPNLEDVLSVDVWNECLTEKERLGLVKILHDMDQETYMCTMMELFKGCNFHFGSPLKKLFDMLKGGLREPRDAFYREGQNFFDKREHYHFLRMHQNGLVRNLCQIKDAWLNCKGYNIKEKLCVLNIVKSQKSLMCEKEVMAEPSSLVQSVDDGNNHSDAEDGLDTIVSQTCQVNKIEVQYDKTSKQVDVQALKETLWDYTKKKVIVQTMPIRGRILSTQRRIMQ
ncbi:hypothetical protein CRG98_014658 [Punica granatum]|uniref:DEUBAD domain-containing protein n=1 Tax=Punica granatum TaxID=22663 RepID=A0A2I0K8U2_PUNGR|nr:hypothetical protein CRG98_014658 [Punica granatum]